jgi:TRAP-type mannitol/chloroaromatic compound transport system permease small subunit
MEHIVRIIERLTDNVGYMVSWLVVPLVSALIIEVIFRYGLNSPTIWANDVTQYIFGYIFLLGGAYTLGKNGHVRVDVMFHVIPDKARHVLTLISYIPIYVYLAVLFYIGGERFWNSLVGAERFNLSIWEPYLWPVLICIPCAALLMLLRLFAMTWREFESLLVRPSNGN